LFKIVSALSTHVTDMKSCTFDAKFFTTLVLRESILQMPSYGTSMWRSVIQINIGRTGFKDDCQIECNFGVLW
jgi:hypothetical protein